jgi:hypothetical protein
VWQTPHMKIFVQALLAGTLTKSVHVAPVDISPTDPIGG